MARVPKPNSTDLVDAYRRRPAVNDYLVEATIVNIFAVSRVYDRSTGNFKAVGWYCHIYFRSRGEIRREKEPVVILDSEIIPRTQRALPSGD